MSRQWQPGDVAMVVCSDGAERAALSGWRMGCMSWTFKDGSWREVEESEARPLVVIDPEDREQVDRFLAAADRALSHPRDERLHIFAAALREFANPTPPKPEEPTGLGAVVEDVSGDRYVRHCPGDCEDRGLCIPWRRVRDALTRTYAEIPAVRVLSEGVTA